MNELIRVRDLYQKKALKLIEPPIDTRRLRVAEFYQRAANSISQLIAHGHTIWGQKVD